MYKHVETSCTSMKHSGVGLDIKQATLYSIVVIVYAFCILFI